MAKETITNIRCDICSKEAESYGFLHDRRMDAAGSSNNIYYDADLCAVHFGELVRKHGHPKEHYERVVGRSAAIAYGSGVKDWAELQEVIWGKMTIEERTLALEIENL